MPITLDNLTIVDIINMSAPHHCILGAARTVLRGKTLTVCVAGGSSYVGDFINTFDVTIYETKTKKFVTDRYFPSIQDVTVTLTARETEAIVNRALKTRVNCAIL